MNRIRIFPSFLSFFHSTKKLQSKVSKIPGSQISVDGRKIFFNYEENTTILTLKEKLCLIFKKLGYVKQQELSNSPIEFRKSNRLGFGQGKVLGGNDKIDKSWNGIKVSLKKNINAELSVVFKTEDFFGKVTVGNIKSDSKRKRVIDSGSEILINKISDPSEKRKLKESFKEIKFWYSVVDSIVGQNFKLNGKCHAFGNPDKEKFCVLVSDAAVPIGSDLHSLKEEFEKNHEKPENQERHDEEKPKVSHDKIEEHKKEHTKIDSDTKKEFEENKEEHRNDEEKSDTKKDEKVHEKEHAKIESESEKIKEEVKIKSEENKDKQNIESEKNEDAKKVEDEEKLLREKNDKEILKREILSKISEYNLYNSSSYNIKIDGKINTAMNEIRTMLSKDLKDITIEELKGKKNWVRAEFEKRKERVNEYISVRGKYYCLFPEDWSDKDSKKNEDYNYLNKVLKSNDSVEEKTNSLNTKIEQIKNDREKLRNEISSTVDEFISLYGDRISDENKNEILDFKKNLNLDDYIGTYRGHDVFGYKLGEKLISLKEKIETIGVNKETIENAEENFKEEFEKLKSLFVEEDYQKYTDYFKGSLDKISELKISELEEKTEEIKDYIEKQKVEYDDWVKNEIENFVDSNSGDDMSKNFKNEDFKEEIFQIYKKSNGISYKERYEEASNEMKKRIENIKNEEIESRRRAGIEEIKSKDEAEIEFKKLFDDNKRLLEGNKYDNFEEENKKLNSRELHSKISVLKNEILVSQTKINDMVADISNKLKKINERYLDADSKISNETINDNIKEIKEIVKDPNSYSLKEINKKYKIFKENCEKFIEIDNIIKDIFNKIGILNKEYVDVNKRILDENLNKNFEKINEIIEKTNSFSFEEIKNSYNVFVNNFHEFTKNIADNRKIWESKVNILNFLYKKIIGTYKNVNDIFGINKMILDLLEEIKSEIEKSLEKNKNIETLKSEVKKIDTFFKELTLKVEEKLTPYSEHIKLFTNIRFNLIESSKRLSSLNNDDSIKYFYDRLCALSLEVNGKKRSEKQVPPEAEKKPEDLKPPAQSQENKDEKPPSQPQESGGKKRPPINPNAVTPTSGTKKRKTQFPHDDPMPRALRHKFENKDGPESPKPLKKGPPNSSEEK